MRYRYSWITLSCFFLFALNPMEITHYKAKNKPSDFPILHIHVSFWLTQFDSSLGASFSFWFSSILNEAGWLTLLSMLGYSRDWKLKRTCACLMLNFGIKHLQNESKIKDGNNQTTSYRMQCRDLIRDFWFEYNHGFGLFPRKLCCL